MPPRRLLPQFLPWATLASAPAFAFLAFQTRHELDFLASSTSGLFYVVGVAAAAAFVTGIAAVRLGGRGRATAGDTALAELRAGYTESIINLTAAMEAKDGYTVGRGERVAALSVLLGSELRLSSERLQALAHGAMLSDVGKIGISDRILHKPGELSEQEFEVIKRHTLRGVVMLSKAVTGATELAIIRHHHERSDGTGYPDGLSGRAIPLEARVVGLADAYDALRSPRSHRPAWDAELAQRHVRERAGTHFDPDCVQAFLRVVDRWEAQHGPATRPAAEERPAA